jgi:hypothetical protein
LRQRHCAQFSNVVDIHFVSCANGKGVDQLQAHLQTLIARQDHIGQPLPSNYLELEKHLASQAKERMPPIVSWTEYRAMARLCLIDGEQDLLTATSLLHNFGSLVHFPNDEKVKNPIFYYSYYYINW